jgi:hypothetical protein
VRDYSHTAETLQMRPVLRLLRRNSALSWPMVSRNGPILPQTLAQPGPQKMFTFAHFCKGPLASEIGASVGSPQVVPRKNGTALERLRHH